MMSLSNHRYYVYSTVLQCIVYSIYGVMKQGCLYLNILSLLEPRYTKKIVYLTIQDVYLKVRNVARSSDNGIKCMR